jgi:hypothetical protein
MRIDLPACNLKNCRCYSDGNCKYRIEYEKCEYARLRNYIYYAENVEELKEHIADAERIAEARKRTEKYDKRV